MASDRDTPRMAPIARPRAEALTRAALVPAGALDAIRVRLIALLGPLARPLLVERDVRIAVLGSLLVLVAALSTAAIPLWAIAFGPLVWGVPHVVADLRYLVLRPGLHRRYLVLAPIAIGIIASLFGRGLFEVLVGASFAVALSSGGTLRRSAVVLAIAPLAYVTYRWPIGSLFVFVHAHNAVGVALFLFYRRQASWLRAVPIALAAVIASAIAFGAFDVFAGDRPMPVGLSWETLAAGLAPVADETWQRRLVLLYAFGQAVHYVVWLRLVPEGDRRSPRPRSFRQSVRALANDVGWPLLLLHGGAMFFFLGYAFVGVAVARDQYLQAAFFHGYLELAVAALWLAEGRPTP